MLTTKIFELLSWIAYMIAFILSFDGDVHPFHFFAFLSIVLMVASRRPVQLTTPSTSHQKVNQKKYNEGYDKTFGRNKHRGTARRRCPCTCGHSQTCNWCTSRKVDGVP